MACAGMRAVLVAWFCASALAGHAAELELLSVTQSKPGEVKVLVSALGGEAPKASDFQLRLDAGHAIAAASIAAVPPASVPSVALLLCLDRSGSMGTAVAAMRNALRDSLVPYDGSLPLPFSVAIVAFGTRTTHLLTLSSDAQQVAAAIARLELEHERGGKTRLHDAVAGGLAELRNSEATEKHLLVVSDGNDEGSLIPQRQLIEQAMGAPSIPVDAIGFGAQASSSSGSLSTLAGATGGRFTIAGTQDELRAMLGRLVQQAVSAPRFEISFAYSPAGEGLASGPASLVHAPAGGTPAEWALKIDLSAVAEQTIAVSAEVPASPPSIWLRIFPFLQSPFFATVPTVVWVGGALLLLAIVIGIAVVLLRSRPEEPEPGQPEAAPFPSTHVHVPAGLTSQPPARAQPPSRRMTVVSHRWPAPDGEQPLAMLSVLSGAEVGRRFEIRHAQTRIGSAADNELVLADDDFASGHHALLRAELNGLYLADLGSRNGSLLNGERFKDGVRSLAPGDHFTLGRTEFEVTSAAAPKAQSVAIGTDPRSPP